MISRLWCWHWTNLPSGSTSFSCVHRLKTFSTFSIFPIRMPVILRLYAIISIILSCVTPTSVDLKLWCPVDASLMLKAVISWHFAVVSHDEGWIITVCHLELSQAFSKACKVVLWQKSNWLNEIAEKLLNALCYRQICEQDEPLTAGGFYLLAL